MVSVAFLYANLSPSEYFFCCFKHSTHYIANILYIPHHVPNMDMDTSMPMHAMGDGSSSALNASAVDFSNDTQAMDFLEQLLDDSDLQISGNAFARYFWYGIVVVVAIAAIFNIVQKITLRLRYAHSLTVRNSKHADVMRESALQLPT